MISGVTLPPSVPPSGVIAGLPVGSQRMEAETNAVCVLDLCWFDSFC